jgi:hypothetical protein
MGFEIGLSDAALERLGYRHPLGRPQKVLLLISVFCGFVPMWLLFRTRTVAQETGPAVVLFAAHAVAWIVLVAWLVEASKLS